MNSATFADEETWFELIRTAGRTFSFVHAADGFAEAADTKLCEGNDLWTKQMLKNSQMASWIALACIC